MKRKLGQLETQFMAYVQLRKLRQIRTGDVAGPLGLSPLQERELFRRMARSGMIARVWRGLYLVPPSLPLGGLWTPDPIAALKALMDARGARWQLCGPSAFGRYSFDDQVPNRLYAYNNRLSGDRVVGAVEMTLTKVADARLGDTEEVSTPEGKAVYPSRARALVDAVYDWSRFNGLPRAYEWIQRELAAERVNRTELVAVTVRYGNQATIRRVGALLEMEASPENLLRQLERQLRPTSSLIPWIPTRPKRGKVNQRWGVVVND